MKEKKSIPEKHVKTIELVAYLMSQGFMPVGERQGEGKFRWAVFEDTEALRKAIEAFYSNSEAMRFFDFLRRAKQYLMD